MPAKLFVFVQFEVPFPLGPPDGRYVMREQPGGDPQHVLVLRSEGDGSTRVTVIDAIPLSAEAQARAWMEELDNERQLDVALGRLNRALLAYRVAAADQEVRKVALRHASRAAIGWGTGEQVADGQYSEAVVVHSRMLRPAPPRPGELEGIMPGRHAADSAHDRFAALLGERDRALLCEELALRARDDLRAGRSALAAIELERAYSAALEELGNGSGTSTGGSRRRGRPAVAGLAERLEELRCLYPLVSAESRVAIPAAGSARPGTEQAQGGEDLDLDLLERALSRLEAALRARAAGL